MSVDQILTSIHGRRLGLSATGALLMQQRDSTGMSRAVTVSSANIREETIAESVLTCSGSAVVITNSGFTHVTSDMSVNGAALTVSAPAAGVLKEIFLDSSASTVSLGSTAAGITFGASVGSSVRVMDAAGGVRGTSIVLRGLSTTRWAILGGRKLGD